MTVNDGLPLDEPAFEDRDSRDRLPPVGAGVAGQVTDPPTDMLPRQTGIAADAVGQEDVNAPAVPPTSNLPTEALPLGPPAAPPPADPMAQGSVEGDLFDDRGA